MNQRIQELREQAMQWVLDNHQTQDPDTVSQEEIDQRFLMYEGKFAELIVKECMAVANTYQNRGGNCYVDDMIAKHFGVEE